MRPERGKSSHLDGRGYDANDFSLISQVKRIETEDFTEPANFGPDRDLLFIHFDADLRRLRNFIQDACDTPASCDATYANCNTWGEHRWSTPGDLWAYLKQFGADGAKK